MVADGSFRLKEDRNGVEENKEEEEEVRGKMGLNLERKLGEEYEMGVNCVRNRGKEEETESNLMLLMMLLLIIVRIVKN
jgi:hypothetical protein